jgi:hypothetical protein
MACVKDPALLMRTSIRPTASPASLHTLDLPLHANMKVMWEILGRPEIPQAFSFSVALPILFDRNPRYLSCTRPLLNGQSFKVHNGSNGSNADSGPSSTTRLNDQVCESSDTDAGRDFRNHLFTLPFILTRACVNAYVAKACHIENYLSYITYVGCIAYTAAIVHAETVGMARHMWDISIATFTQISYVRNIVLLCYTATSGLAKTVVFLQLKKIFTTGPRGVVFWVNAGSLTDNALFIYRNVLPIRLYMLA